MLKRFDKKMLGPLVLTSFTFIGLQTFASACHGDKPMHCNQVQTVVSIILVGILMLQLLTSFVQERKKKIILLILTLIPIEVFGLIPGTIMPLCMKETMHCHTHMSPFLKVTSVVLIVIHVVLILVSKGDNKNESDDISA